MNDPQSAAAPSTSPASPGFFRRLDGVVVAANRWLLILGLAAMCCIIFVSVTLRYTTHYAVPWSEEIARYLMLWITFIGAGPVFRAGGHIAIDSLENALPRRAAQVVRAIVAVLVVGFVLFLIVTGIQYAQRTAIQTTPVTNIPFTWVTASLPVGFALSLWHISVVLVGFVRDHKFEESSDLNPAEVGSL